MTRSLASARQRGAQVLLLLLAFAAGGTAAEGAPVPPAAAIDERVIEAALGANTVHGLVALVRRLDELGARSFELDAPLRRALYRGMPPRIRAYFSRSDAQGEPLDLVGVGLARDDAGAWRLEMRFTDDWLARRGEAGRRMGGKSSKGHEAAIYLSRRNLVTARVVVDGIRDPRAAAGAKVPYGVIQHNARVFTEDIDVRKLARHPWRDRAPLGLADLEGLSLQVDVTGWWKNACDIQPCTHLVIYEDRPDAEIWLAYMEMAAHVDRKRGFMQVGPEDFADGLTASQAFPSYLTLEPKRDDHFSLINLSLEGRE